MRIVVLGALASGVLFGCAHQAADGAHVGIHSGASTGVQANLTQAGLYGPDVSISRVESGYRGTSLGDIIDLQWSEAAVKGVVGSTPVKLSWSSQADNGLRIQGLWSGRISDILVDGGKINGTMGACSYQLVRDNAVYRGFQQCGNITQRNTVLELPAELAQHEPGDRVALLGLLLGGYRAGAGTNAAAAGDMGRAPVPSHWRSAGGGIYTVGRSATAAGAEPSGPNR